MIDGLRYGLVAMAWLAACAGIIVNLMVRRGSRSLVVGAVLLCVATIWFVASLFAINGMVSFP